MKKHRWNITLALTVLLLGGGLLFLWQTGFFAAATSLEGIRAYIEEFSLLFGMWPAFLLTWAAVALGSLVVFCLARALGQKFVERFVSEKVSERYLGLMKRKRDVFLCLVFLFPFFPDDIICILAGLTDIKRTRFAMIVVLFRPWGLLVACGVGGSVISIPLWGMVLIGIAGAILFLVGLKYGDRVEACLLERMKKR